jgi:amino acid transporter
VNEANKNMVHEKSKLKANCLSFVEVLAQSISNIAPSAVPVLVIPAVFALTGNGTWLTLVFAIVVVALVGHHINQFASRSSSPGALYTFVSEGLGSFPGYIAGCALIFAYMLDISAVTAGFANYFNITAGYLGLHISPKILFLVCIISACIMAYKDVQISAKTMLIFEAISLSTVLILLIIVFINSNHKFDMQQLSLQGTSISSMRMGLVLSFLAFVGFEAATTLGHEAKNPLKTIPRAVIGSVLFVGIFFVISAYCEILGFSGSETALNESASPLSELADMNGVGFLGIIISIGATLSCWSCVIACLISGARIILTMGSKNYLPKAIARIHKDNKTPYVAIFVLTAIACIITLALSIFGLDAITIFSIAGTIATFGFLVNYAMIVISAPVYLYKRKELKPIHIVVSIITFLLVLIPIIGSVYPLPAYPFSLLPFIFMAWILIAVLWFMINKKKSAAQSRGFAAE